MEIVKGSSLYDILEKYSQEDEHLGQRLVDLQKRINNREIYIPFLGVQGAGKSTLINSLLGEDILPNEADETTCIPVEVRYSDKPIVKVYKNDDEAETINLSKDEIALYVDNTYNPGNEKGIKRIVIENKYEVLKNGVIIVDLPGVGSLTHENEETTVNYIQKVSATVFLFSTTPPILKKEAKFIESIWRNINNAFFVQNVWNDISEKEKQEGLERNRNTLLNISEKINASYDGKVIPINAWAAAKGNYTQNAEMIKKSNIDELKTEMASFAVNYAENAEKSFRNRVLMTVDYVKDILEEKIDQSSMSYDEVMDELREKKRSLEDKTDEIRKIARNIEDKLYEDKKEIKKFAKEEADVKTNLLKTEMHQLINKGIVDGSQLDVAFSDYQNQHEIEACDDAYEKLNKLSEDLQSDYESLLISLDVDKEMSEEKVVFNKKKKLKWEKGAKTIMILGADIGGMVAGGAIGTATTTALAATTIGAAAGPLGIIVGAAAGITICLLGAGVATLFKKGVSATRGAITKNELEPFLEEYRNKLESTIIRYSEDCLSQIENDVNKFVESMKKQVKSINDEISEMRRNGEEMKYSETELKDDYNYLKKWEMENV